MMESMELKKTEIEFMELLNRHAKKWADKFGYQLSSDETYDVNKEGHPLNVIHNKPLRHVNYNGDAGSSYVKTRQRFGSPRIDISSPNQEWFVALEFRDCKISQCQIFKEKGFDMMPLIKKEIEEEWSTMHPLTL